MNFNQNPKIEQDKNNAAKALIALLVMSIVEFAFYDANRLWLTNVTRFLEDVGAILLVVAIGLFISAVYFLKRDEK
ncbi:hypothetical protein SAMN04487792_1526 [Lactobacillus bombicola]|uniref:Uncharacterized protein n=1 Tax=Lactobacillus bombicola TaxID=1505723 RepID=A0A1I1TX99_9LACO|nr:hypothetical protein [Lactobacillus bombicola]SFD60200.1 hypothetical protein SAMN04487792_1526 [Lactobacillus bombicola]